MTDTEMIHLAGELGFSRCAVVETAAIPFEPSFRRYCEDNVCGKYGANYTCPPDCGTAEEMRLRVQAYRHALVLQSRWEIDGCSGSQVKAAKAAHNRWTRELIDRAGGVGLMAGASGCDLCAPCLRAADEACRFPALRFSCLSAYCIDVAKLAHQCGMEYFSQDAVRFFSMYCFGAAQ